MVRFKVSQEEPEILGEVTNFWLEELDGEIYLSARRQGGTSCYVLYISKDGYLKLMNGVLPETNLALDDCDYIRVGND